MSEQLKPELRFPEFDGDWFETSLEQLMTFKNGVNAGKENYGFGYKFINVLDIIENDFIVHDLINDSVNISKDEFEKNIVEYGDILFQRSSETRAEVGQANVYIDEQRPATFGGFVIRGKKKSDYNPFFMNYLLKTRQSRLEIMKKSGGSTRYNVGQSTLSEVVITTTAIDEQQKIANFLKAIDKRIKLLKAKKDALEDYKTSIMQKLFSQEIRFKQEDGSDFPEWEEKALFQISNKTSSNIAANSLDEDGGDFKIYGATGFLQKVDFYTEEQEYISIVKDGAGVGRVLLCDAYSSVLGTLDIIRTIEENDLRFLYELLQNMRFERYVSGSTIPHIYFKDYSKAKFLIPHPDEQKKVSSFAKKLDLRINVLDSLVNDSAKLKESLLQKMFL
ncbi:type I restriction endonuclease subunit S [Dokdonia pacifica]|uniref:Type I restriction enzyme, S subunit n=1 Tax=Dokdonia pacifica TaxID=1627892 RepID=A0A238YZT3_9FLAO|nr:restriction endonuclease subunit S [Dokdonia pacifica]GGG09033.1 type I restriction endonuclease subunit S [Dokdonia pacifica]SNR76665.1 type I restriction enzyme, S subunit [Dokdonia pacifica]